MKEHWFTWRDDILTLRLHVQPGARKNEINGLFNHRLRIRLTAPPVDGKANQEIIAMLAREFKTRKSQVRISGGQLGRDKTIDIEAPTKLPDWFTRLAEGKTE